jgi:ABC-type lipoprotein release transport system permease subunit
VNNRLSQKHSLLEKLHARRFCKEFPIVISRMFCFVVSVMSTVSCFLTTTFPYKIFILFDLIPKLVLKYNPLVP